MTTSQLRTKHVEAYSQPGVGIDRHTIVSIQFAISVLKKLELCHSDDEYVKGEIKKLKQYIS